MLILIGELYLYSYRYTSKHDKDAGHSKNLKSRGKREEQSALSIYLKIDKSQHGKDRSVALGTMYFPKQHYESIVPEKSGIKQLSASLFPTILHYDVTLPLMLCLTSNVTTRVVNLLSKMQ